MLESVNSTGNGNCPRAPSARRAAPRILASRRDCKCHHPSVEAKPTSHKANNRGVQTSEDDIAGCSLKGESCMTGASPEANGCANFLSVRVGSSAAAGAAGRGRWLPTTARNAKGTRNLSEASVQSQKRALAECLRKANATKATMAEKTVDCQT